MSRKALTFAVVFLLSLSLCLEDTFAQRRSSGGSRSSFGSSRSSGSSSSKYSSGSRSSGSSKYSSGSRSSGSKSKYGSGSGSSTSKPKYGSGTGSSSSGSKSKYGSGSGSSTSKPKYGSGSSSSSSGSKWNSGTSAKSRAAAKQQSQRKYESTKKATAPPKSSYTSSSGKTVNVRKDSTAVQTMRSRPSTDYTPAARTQRTEVHITNYGYSHPYSYYRSYDPYYVGGGYSSAFWWMMMEWNAERRARWLYHNQANIESAAYQKGMQDAAVAAELARLKAENTVADPNYIDSEFKDNPDLMYDQDYVEAAYNPTVVPPSSGAGTAVTILLWLIIICFLCYVGYYVVFKVRWGS